MDKKKAKRICRVLCAVSILLMAVSALTAFGCVLCCVHGNLKAALPLVASIVVFYIASEFVDAVERRSNGEKA